MNRQARNATRETLICFAVKEELASFRKILKDSTAAEILVTGIGPANARKSFLNALADSPPPKSVWTCGFAGALDPRFEIGDVIFHTEHPPLAEALEKCGAKAAKFHCASRIAVTSEEKAQLRQATSADAVEMESGVIHDICRERGIARCATIRVISDTAHETLPLDFNALMTEDQVISLMKMSGALLRSPGKIPALLRLQRNTQRAADRLSATLVELLRVI